MRRKQIPAIPFRACRFLLYLGLLASHALAQNDTVRTAGQPESEVEFLPILSYDTDAGFGYGVKVFAVGELGSDESFDLTLFHSTKGERWYRFVVSLPDFERRQGTVYPVACDLVVDYDKWIAASFFGVGNDSKFEDREYYTKEPIEVSLTVSRGFTPHQVVQAGVRYKATRNFNFEDSSTLKILPPPLNASRAAALSFFMLARYDTRNSYINPSDGLVLQGEVEGAPAWSLNDVSFVRVAGWLQYYRLLFQSLVVAGRLGIGGISGGDLPVQFLLPVGGGWTVRGSPQDRLLDRVTAVANAEIRFPIVWRLGGVLGGDAGQVWDRVAHCSFDSWKVNAVVGLRFAMDTFIVRLDVGIGTETTGWFLNFGHVF